MNSSELKQSLQPTLQLLEHYETLFAAYKDTENMRRATYEIHRLYDLAGLEHIAPNDMSKRKNSLRSNIKRWFSRLDHLHWTLLLCLGFMSGVAYWAADRCETAAAQAVQSRRDAVHYKQQYLKLIYGHPPSPSNLRTNK